MPLSDETRARCNEAFEALIAFREEYGDVLVVLDYISVLDIANYQSDSADGVAGQTLTEEEMQAVLWHSGKHVGGTSNEILASLVEFALDEHVRRNIAQRFGKNSD